jgi:hypothetical protein
VKIIKVPHFLELSSTRVYVLAMSDTRIRDYLPDYEHEKPINRQYLFNVSILLYLFYYYFFITTNETPTYLSLLTFFDIDCELSRPKLL